MILRRVSLHPFAGFARRIIELEPGMNVIRGPNDRGKSTLFRAIEAALFLPVRLKASTIEGRELGRILPIGGDHARVGLEFEANGRSYQLEKTWGAEPAVSLQLPDGARLTTAERVEQELRAILPVPPGSFRSVLLVSQGSLDRTVRELAENHESLHTLGDALRLAVSRTDGVSVDRVQALLRGRLEEVFLNWDPDARAPRKNRGIENPWDRQGSLLRAFYARERLRRKLAETQALEADLGEKTRRLSESLARQAELRRHVADNEKIVDAASSRQTLELQLGQADREAQALSRDLSAWLQAESDRKVLEPEIARLEVVIGDLGRELRDARLQLERRTRLARFERIEAARKELEELRRGLAGTPVVRAEDLQRLREGWGAIERLKAGLSASRLEIQFTARTPMGVVIRRDIERERRETLQPGIPIQIQAGGRIQLSSEHFEAVITSGDGRIVRIEEELKRESEGLRRLLATLGVRSLEEAQDRHEKWAAASQAVRSAEVALNALLGGESYEELRALREPASASASASVPAPASTSTSTSPRPDGALPAPPSPPSSRDPERIEGDYAAAHERLAARKGELAAQLRVAREISERHCASEPARLTSLMIGKGVEQEGLRARLAALAPLPEGIGDVAAYIEGFKRARSELLELSEKLRELSNAVVELKARAPEHSAQEIDRQYREARAAFERELRRGQALLRVSGAIQSMLSEDGDVYEGFRASLEGILCHLSAGKYARARMEGALPTELFRDDGALVPFSWLSAGTRDGFALCLRLAMARRFLGDSRGFVLLDDPMVAMDPDRQRIVSELLAELAGEAQLVVFTCHPGHALLLGGHQISI